jgi:RNA polymerase sigma-70 factor (ECF subfamily)
VDQRRLVEQAQRGDHDAFAELARRVVVRLDRAARLILRDPELARDGVQDGLIRAWRDLPTLQDPDRFEAWVHRLVANACIDLTRRRRSRPIEVELLHEHAPEIPDASGLIAQRDLVDGVLRRLDPSGRAIVVLHYYAGLPLLEVAATLRIPIGTVKSRLHRALRDMRVAIDDPDTAAGDPLRERTSA